MPQNPAPARNDDQHGKWYDAIFSIPYISQSSHEETLMHQFVEAITSAFTHRSCIGIDFNDVIRIMHEGRFGKMVIEIAAGADNASISAKCAIEHFDLQGADVSTASGASCRCTWLYCAYL